MSNKFKLESSFEIMALPVRYFCLALFLLFLLAYFLLGHSNNSELTAKTGIVQEFKSTVAKKRGDYRYNITLHDIPDTVYFQNYYIDVAVDYIWCIDRDKLANLNSMIKPNDTVTFFYNPNEEYEVLKSGKTGLKTYGLVVNGETIIDVSKRKYFTFGIGLLGTLACLSALATLFIFGRDILLTVGERKNYTKMK